MPYLSTYTEPLTTAQASHLLRRATFGPTPNEITQFTGLTATQAVQQLIANQSFVTNPPPPVELDSSQPLAGQPFLDKPFNSDRNFWFGTYIKFWWAGQMARQDVPVSLLDKLALFWQNHFVTTRTVVDDYRYLDRYLRLIRAQALGNFRTFVVEITKDPAMLRYLNGHDNEKDSPNENYARELQELFTVGNKDFAGNDTYTEEDVKAAARVLTGWKYTNYWQQGSTSFTSIFRSDKHDSDNKQFSSYYGNAVLTGRSGSTAGDDELNDLVDMLLAHPETPKFICRKLYRWYVNAAVTQEIEDQVIIPLANFFKSPGNNFAIMPVVEKLLTSQIFFQESNRGSLIKSPAELMLGSLRFFEQPIPDPTTDYQAFRKLMDFLHWNSTDMQMECLDQPTVFGYDAYFQTGYTKNWMNTTTIALRSQFTDALIWRWFEVKPGYKLGVDVLARVTALQPNFADVPGTPAITCETVVANFVKDLFATELFPSQIEFLTDTIMMMGYSRVTWQFEWNAYRSNPSSTDRQNTILWRTRSLMRYLLRMAEYHVF
ncbi:DUF1800 domain-containing protein [Arundinibacter roseus]|uniref:DUF1800 domain-containing protein n=1 Tax=Arundinibacter roseus TaxID=2070510 RepID=A0A4R4KMK6_9BACT|nr:DUF1800 domain-containing protein [Arundinibacter roseus]TDB68232.1 DUF1800 domain-containing protein [Arundinibacter roseus]